MPSYDFKNNKTGEITNHVMKISELDKFKQDNPDLTQHITSVNWQFKDNTLKKAGDGWKEVQDKIRSGQPPRFRDNIKTK